MTWAFLIIACLLGGFGGAYLISLRGHRWGLLDLPSDRSSHSHPMPRGGGVGIVAAMIVGGVVLNRPLWFWGVPGLLGIVGLIDDRLNLPARTRLVFQFLGAAAWVLFCWREGGLSLPEALLGVFWIVFVVGSANFFNFMDGINGIAAISGSIGFGLLALFGAVQFQTPQALFCLAIAAACLGFLPFNFPRARVFMGDVGSIPLGFAFGAMVFSMTASAADFICLSSFLFLFYADAVSTLFIRWHRGERLAQSHREHLYQVLANELKISHAAVSLGYGGLQLSIGLIMFFLWQSGLVWQVLFLLFLTCGFLLTTFKVRRSPHVQPRGSRITPPWKISSY